VLDLAAGESLADHEVNERAWLVVVNGDVEVGTATGESTSGGAGLLVELAPGERHEVVASSKARLLLLLTPWPGEGHPGAMTIREKLYAPARGQESTVSPQRRRGGQDGCARRREARPSVFAEHGDVQHALDAAPAAAEAILSADVDGGAGLLRLLRAVAPASTRVRLTDRRS